MNKHLTITNLTLTNDGAPLCNDLSFSIAPREVLTIMGPSGSGKSTILSWIRQYKEGGKRSSSVWDRIPGEGTTAAPSISTRTSYYGVWISSGDW